MTDSSAIATEYGKALFLLCEEVGSADGVLSDVNILSAALAANGDYLKLLDTPALPKEEKLALADRSTAGLNEYLQNTVKLLIERHRAYLIPAVLRAYVTAYEKARGIERVEAVSAVPLSAEQTERLRAKLSALTGKQIIVSNTVEPELLGGMKLRYMGIQLDGTVRSRLESFEKSLRSLIV